METILCLSSQKWDDPMWTNKQHIMSRLARDHRVVHVDYGLRPLPLYLYRRLRKRPSDALHPARLLYDGVSHREGNLYVADHCSPLIAGALPHGSLIRDRATFDLKVLFLRRWLARERISDPIVWVYHPGYADAVARLPRKLLVYDCVDNYAAFPAYREDPDWLMAREAKLCREADLVFCTSQRLYETRREHNPDNTFLVHNVGDAEHFGRALDPTLAIPDDLAALRARGPVIGFVGAVSDYKLNMGWILHAAKQRPDWQLVLIGPVGEADPDTDVAQAQRAPNVHLMGYRDYASLPAYLKGFDVAVIPYHINAYTESVFPIKFFEFLATGKPVVCSPLPAIRPYADAVHIADTAEGFVQACAASLAAPAQGQARRLALAEEHSWPRRVAALMGHIERKLAAR